MPQMAPIGWLSLFIIFSLAFLLFSLMNYYSFLPSSPNFLKSSQEKTTAMNWKW
uniref:ATP synthase complex subunit 8 n=1 Tax=Pseudogriphoneura sp. ACMJ-2016 TaxID=1783256 RepID=A0A140CP96_9MUSC|nr:ATP synthase F0 subunit 8 [Pseudogriphoneura sp. ACMJ-2016]